VRQRETPTTGAAEETGAARDQGAKRVHSEAKQERIKGSEHASNWQNESNEHQIRKQKVPARIEANNQPSVQASSIAASKNIQAAVEQPRQN
jgi:hypothetical protein